MLNMVREQLRIDLYCIEKSRVTASTTPPLGISRKKDCLLKEKCRTPKPINSALEKHAIVLTTPTEQVADFAHFSKNIK